MKTSFALAVLSLFYTHCLAASVDMWSSPLKERAALKYEAIEPEVIKARLGTTPDENSEGGRESGMVWLNCSQQNTFTKHISGLLLPWGELGSSMFRLSSWTWIYMQWARPWAKGTYRICFHWSWYDLPSSWVCYTYSYVRILLTKQDSTMIDVPRSKYLPGPRPNTAGLTYSIRMPQEELWSSELQQHISHALSVPTALRNLDKTGGIWVIDGWNGSLRGDRCRPGQIKLEQG
jgi:hypothetical protein